MLSQLGSPWLHLRSCGSTSDEARKLGKAGKPHGTVVTADEQTSGRGRQGRSWYSPPGDNLYLSLLLRPPLEPRAVPLLTLCAGLAVLETASALLAECGSTASPLLLKWPNDLLAQTPSGLRKVAGILTEMTLAAGRCDFVVCGIGVNVLGRSFPPSVPATSLVELVPSWSLVLSVHDVAIRLLQTFEPLYQRFLRDGAPWVTSAFSEKATLTAPGQAVTIATAAGTVAGISLGIDHDGALLVRKDDGFVERVLAGDLVYAMNDPRRSPDG